MDIIFSMNLIKRAFTVATDNCTLFGVLGTWSGVVAASVVAVIYHRQLREMQKQLKVMQQATRVAALPSLSHLETPKIRAAREIVRRYTTKSDYDKKNERWSCEAQRKAVVTTLAAYDFAGGIAKAALDEGNDLYLRVFRLCWGRSIKGVAETCSDFIDDMQKKKEDEDYYKPFLWLARRCGYSAEKQSDPEKSRIGMIPPLIRLKVD